MRLSFNSISIYSNKFVFNFLILLSSECLSCPISVYCASNLFLPNNFFLSLTFLNLAFFDLIYLIYLNYERH